MKKVLFLVVAALAFVAFKPAEDEVEKYPTLTLGSEMPMQDAEMLNINGEILSLAKIKGKKGTLVIFSCNTCPFVTQWENRYNEVAELAAKNGIGTVLINSNEAKRLGDDSFEAMKAHTAEIGYTMPYLVDENSALANAFGAKTTPHVFLFNGDNALVYLGSIDDNSKEAAKVRATYLKDAINELAAGKTIKISKTDAKGCSIKRVI
jgi:peroxiredoxin